MLTKEIIVTNKNGLHLRPSTTLAKKVQEFDAKVKICVANVKVEATNILGLLTLGATFGTKLTIEAEGRQSEEVINELELLFKNDFNVVY